MFFLPWGSYSQSGLALIFKTAGDLCNIRAMESIDRVPKHLRHYQKWIPHEEIHRSCGAEVLPASNSRRARPF